MNWWDRIVRGEREPNSQRHVAVVINIDPRSAGLLRQQLDTLRPGSPLAIIAANVLENYYRDEERELGNDIAAGFLDPTEGKR
jgi:hypothetical protein